MSRLITILILCLTIVGIVEAISFSQRDELQISRLSTSPKGEELRREPIPAGQSITLRADADESLAIELDARGSQTAGVLKIAGRNGRAILGSLDRKILASGEQDCAAIAIDGWECKIIWRTNRPEERLPLYPADGAVTIDSVNFTTVSILRAPATTFTGLLLFLAVLILLAPLIVLARRLSSELELFVLISLSATWIATTGAIAMLAIATFLTAGYCFVRLELHRKRTQTSILLPVTGFVVLTLIFFKVIAPYASAAFGQTSSLALPLGLSYFGIRLIDVIFAARARTLKTVSAIEFFGFMLHPSMLTAGPITTIAEFRRARIESWSVIDYGSGIARCLVGLTKKFIADLWLAPAVFKLTQTVALHPEAANARVVWPLLFGQFLYIYFDFTGYTDLALGTGRALGWRLPENFNWPLVRSNLRLYWQSWHMTLSNWVMRRVYFPAYMDSRSPILAAVCAMLTIGVWHQPNFGWTAWALHHGIGLGVTIKFLDVAFREGRPLARFTDRPMGRIVTQFLGWVLTMSWMALGMSYTLFDNYAMSFSALRGAFKF
jgi:D-alanyl-lipoteichoic acid acyltransferase DltB (MBOAT superfamily)